MQEKVSFDTPIQKNMASMKNIDSKVLSSCDNTTECDSNMDKTILVTDEEKSASPSNTPKIDESESPGDVMVKESADSQNTGLGEPPDAEERLTDSSTNDADVEISHSKINNGSSTRLTLSRSNGSHWQVKQGPTTGDKKTSPKPPDLTPKVHSVPDKHVATRKKIVQKNAAIKESHCTIPGFTFVEVANVGGVFKYSCQLCSFESASGPLIAKHLRDPTHLQMLLPSAANYLTKGLSVSKLYHVVQMLGDPVVETSKKVTFAQMKSYFEQSRHCKERPLYSRLKCAFSEIVIVTDKYAYHHLALLKGQLVRVMCVPTMDTKGIKSLRERRAKDPKRLWLLAFGICSTLALSPCFYCELGGCMNPVCRTRHPSSDSKSLLQKWNTTYGQFVGDCKWPDGSSVAVLPLLPAHILVEGQYSHMQLHQLQHPTLVAAHNEISAVKTAYEGLRRQFLDQMPTVLKPLEGLVQSRKSQCNLGAESMPLYVRSIAPVLTDLLLMTQKDPRELWVSCVRQALVDVPYDHVVFLSNQVVLNLMPGGPDDPKFSHFITDKGDIRMCLSKLRSLMNRHGRILALVVPEMSHMMAPKECRFCMQVFCQSPVIFHSLHNKELYMRRLDAIYESRDHLASECGSRCHIIVTPLFPRFMVKENFPTTRKEHLKLHELWKSDPKPLLMREIMSHRFAVDAKTSIAKHWERVFDSSEVNSLITKSLLNPWSFDADEAQSAVGQWSLLLKEMVPYLKDARKPSLKRSLSRSSRVSPSRSSYSESSLRASSLELSPPPTAHMDQKSPPARHVFPPSVQEMVASPPQVPQTVSADVEKAADVKEPMADASCTVVVWNVPPYIKSIYIFRMVTDVYCNAKVTNLSPSSYSIELPHREGSLIFHAMNKYRAVQKHIRATFQGDKKPIKCKREAVQKTRKTFGNVLQMNSKAIADEIKSSRLNIPVLEVDLLKYKTVKCPDHNCMKGYICDYYHSSKDRRRNPWKHNYSELMCPEGPSCRLGDQCNMSHNTMETKYLPSLYKRHMCNVTGCVDRTHCPSSHRGYLDTLFTPQWENLLFVGCENTMPCVWNSLSALRRIPTRNSDTKILVLTECPTFRNVLRATVNPKKEPPQVIVLHSVDCFNVLLDNPGKFSFVGVLIIDGLDVMMRDQGIATRLLVFIKELKKIIDYARLPKIVIVSEEDQNIGRVGKFLNCNLLKAVPFFEEESPMVTPPVVKMEEKSPEKNPLKRPPSESPSSPLLRKKARTDSHPPTPGTHTEGSADQQDLAYIGQNFQKERDAAAKEHKAEYAAYEQVPDIHPDCETQYELFLRQFTATNGRPKDKDEQWLIFWKNFVEQRSVADWKIKLQELREKHLPKSSLHHTKIEPYSVASTIDILDSLKSKFGAFESALSQILKDARAAGPSAGAMFKVMSDPNAVDVLKMILFKMEKLCDSCDSASMKRVYETGVTYTKRLLSDAKATPPTLDIESIAHATSGKSIAFTIDVIKTALAYEGHAEPTDHVINQVYLDVCSHHFKLSEKMT